jgi:hypothetical protein
LGFWASKTLLSAVELGLFSTLAEGQQTCRRFKKSLRCISDQPATSSMRW